MMKMPNQEMRVTAWQVHILISILPMAVRLFRFFDDKYDEPAMELITKGKVVGVHGREILLCGGCVHCITQQQPSDK